LDWTDPIGLVQSDPIRLELNNSIHKHYSEVDLAIYLDLKDQSGMYYQYTEIVLGDIIDKLQQAHYI